MRSVALSLEPHSSSSESVGAFARSSRDELERRQRSLGVVLVELGELEPEAWIVDALDERREIRERPSLVASGFRDFTARPNGFASPAAFYRTMRDLAGQLERSGSPHGTRDAGPIDGTEA